MVMDFLLVTIKMKESSSPRARSARWPASFMMDVLLGGSFAAVTFTSRIITTLFLSVKSWYPRGDRAERVWMRSLVEQEDGPSDCRVRKWPNGTGRAAVCNEADGGQDRGHGGRHDQVERSREQTSPALGIWLWAQKNMGRPQSWAE